MISIKVARIPGNIAIVELEDGACASDALVKAGINTDRNDHLKVNGVSAALDRVLVDGDRVTISQEAKGNI